jgi:hypothetical protein
LRASDGVPVQQLENSTSMELYVRIIESTNEVAVYAI